jgi:hypothetical protein
MGKERSICKSGKSQVQPMVRVLPGTISKGQKPTLAYDFPVHSSKIPEQRKQRIVRRSTLFISASLVL